MYIYISIYIHNTYICVYTDPLSHGGGGDRKQLCRITPLPPPSPKP